MIRALLFALLCPLAAALAGPEDFAPVDTAAERYLKITGLPGAGVLVVDKDGTDLHEKFYGSYDADTQVGIASASKWFAGAVIMSLVDDKKIELDAPASRWLPEFGLGKKASITVRHLFNHTSGLPDAKEVKQAAANTADAALAISRLKLQFPPGEKFLYGGAAMQAGGRIAEIAGNDTWQRLFEARISKPLGMEKTWFAASDFNLNPQVAGGARSTLRDYGRFLQMLLNEGEFEGKRVLSAEAVKELITDRTGDRIEVVRATAARRENFPGYGVGCWTEKKDASGKTIVATSPGAFGFFPWIDLQRGIAAVWMIEDRERVRTRHRNLPDIRAKIETVLDSK
jgi:CubicO group peptidase (beta-lactamase class C family)